MKSNDYPVLLIYSKEDEAWLAKVDLLPGCIADGTTPEEALSNARVAIENWIETTKSLNRPVPPALDNGELEQLFLQQQAAIQQHIQMLVTNAVSQYQKFISSGTKTFVGISGSSYQFGERENLALHQEA